MPSPPQDPTIPPQPVQFSTSVCPFVLRLPPEAPSDTRYVIACRMVVDGDATGQRVELPMRLDREPTGYGKVRALPGGRGGGLVRLTGMRVVLAADARASSLVERTGYDRRHGAGWGGWACWFARPGTGLPPPPVGRG